MANKRPFFESFFGVIFELFIGFRDSKCRFKAFFEFFSDFEKKKFEKKFLTKIWSETT